MIVCPNCKAKLGDGSTLCIVCGTALGPDAETVKAPASAQAAAAQPQQPAPAAPPVPAAQPKPENKDIGQMVKDEHEAQQQAPQPQPATQQPQKPQAQQAEQSLPSQAPPPPDHPSYQQQSQQQYYAQPQGTWQTHPYHQGQPNQCPRCQELNVVYYYHDGTSYCTRCYYRYYWRTPTGTFDSIGRGIDRLLD